MGRKEAGMHGRRPFARALFLGLCLALVVPGLVWANKFAFGRITAGSYFAMQGYQGIRTDPATTNGIAYAHPVQAQFSGGDFVGIGTVKGKGTIGGQHNCVDHYGAGAHWSGYWDRVINGIYTCYNFLDNYWMAGANPWFNITYTICSNFTHEYTWVMSFGSGSRACIVGPSSAANLVSGLESFEPGTYNIDVRYTVLKKMRVGDISWSNFGDTRPGYADAGYTYSYVDNTAFNVYQAPLD